MKLLSLFRRPRRLTSEPQADKRGGLRPRWTVIPSGPTSLTVAGPGLDDLAYEVLDSIAESIYYGDGRADAWADFVIARGNLAGAIERGEQGVELRPLENAVRDAWAELLLEIAATLRLHMGEARLVAGQLDEACGRVGLVAP